MYRVTATLTAAVVLAFLAALLTVPIASATYPGGDGKIVFVRSNQIYTVNTNGTGLRQLTTGAKNYRPKWSPNGQRIAYVHETATGSKDIWVMSGTGTNRVQVTRLGNVTEPTWSPDGRWLAFGAPGPGPGCCGGTEIVLQKIRSTAPFGSAVILLGYNTNMRCCGDDAPSDLHTIPVDRYLAWSPDGSRIAVFNRWNPQFGKVIWMYYPATQENLEYQVTDASCCGNNDWSELTWGPAGQFGYADVVIHEDAGACECEYVNDPSVIRYPNYRGQPGDTAPAPAPANVRLALVNASSGTARIYIQKVDGTNRKLLTTGYQPDWQPKP